MGPQNTVANIPYEPQQELYPGNAAIQKWNVAFCHQVAAVEQTHLMSMNVTPPWCWKYMVNLYYFLIF